MVEPAAAPGRDHEGHHLLLRLHRRGRPEPPRGAARGKFTHTWRGHREGEGVAMLREGGVVRVWVVVACAQNPSSSPRHAFLLLVLLLGHVELS